MLWIQKLIKIKITKDPGKPRLRKSTAVSHRCFWNHRDGVSGWLLFTAVVFLKDAAGINGISALQFLADSMRVMGTGSGSGF